MVALSAVVLLGSAGSAFAGPIPAIPVTPVFPPWVYSLLTASLPATVTGTVVDGSGSPIAGITVEITGETQSSALEAQSFRQSAVTGADGTFVIGDVIQGTYQMRVNEPNGPAADADYREAYPWYDWTWAFEGGTDQRREITGGTMNTLAEPITLVHNGVVTGHAQSGVTAVANSQVTATITDGNQQFMRWAVTDASGNFTIPNAPPGQWSLTYSGAGTAVPVDAAPGSDQMDPADQSVITLSEPETFTLAPGATVDRTAHQFALGCPMYAYNYEYHAIQSTSLNLSGIDVTAVSDTNPDHVYYWRTGDAGNATRYLPVGSYTVTYSDPLGLYLPYDVGQVNATTNTLNLTRQLTPAPNTHLIYGHVSVSGVPGSNVWSWISATYVDPSGWSYPARRVSSNGATNSQYAIRVPNATGLTGNKIRIDVEDRRDAIAGTEGREECPSYVTLSSPLYAGSSEDVLWNPELRLGGKITGTVRDEAGNPVRGVSVAAERRAPNPEMGGETAWMNSVLPQSAAWWTLTDASGNYTISGLPAYTDYRVAFNPDYNPGWPLPIKYKEYYRKVYNDLPLVDSLYSMTAPPVSNHTPVAVTLGQTTTGKDMTIRPGGYVGVHADGPDYPTGAVYSDVMYRVGSTWAEVDSGFSTGGTFEKLWKVLPVGHYRLDYSDYFGRGAGSWEFDLGSGEHKYASVVVPVSMTYLTSGTSKAVLGSFEGLLNGGLEGGGDGGAELSVKQLPSLPATTPSAPPNYIPSGGIYDVALTGATADGVWTLTLPYSSAVPDHLVGNLRIRHIKQNGTAEILVPFRWNTTKHTLQVQTTSLSPFQVMFSKTKVGLSRPSVPSTIRRYRRFSATGMLTPRHSAGAKTSVRLYVYKYSSSKRRYVLIARPWATNSTYRGATRWSVSLKLGKGKYRLTPVAPADTWHLSTTGAYKAFTIT
jgi:hypothetical protein